MDCDCGREIVYVDEYEYWGECRTCRGIDNEPMPIITVMNRAKENHERSAASRVVPRRIQP